MQDRNIPDPSTGLIGFSSPFAGDELDNRNDDGSLVQDFVDIDQTRGDSSLSGDPLTDAALATVPITVAVKGAAFLVTNWLVGEGEGSVGAPTERGQ